MKPELSPKAEWVLLYPDMTRLLEGDATASYFYGYLLSLYPRGLIVGDELIQVDKSHLELIRQPNRPAPIPVHSQLISYFEGNITAALLLSYLVGLSEDPLTTTESKPVLVQGEWTSRPFFTKSMDEYTHETGLSVEQLQGAAYLLADQHLIVIRFSPLSALLPEGSFAEKTSFIALNRLEVLGVYTRNGIPRTTQKALIRKLKTI
jgi:hypothetical protein